MQPDLVVQAGDECFPPAAEVMTEHGWMTWEKLFSMDVYSRPMVMQVHDDLSASFVHPERWVCRPANELLRYEHRSMVSLTTPKHNLVKIHPVTGKLHRREAWDVANTESWRIPRTITYCGGDGWRFSDDELALIMAFQADGTFTKGAARFAFTKQRKVARLHSILKALDIPYNMHTVERGDTQFYIKKADTPWYLTKELYSVMSPTVGTLPQYKVVLEEASLWDGTITQHGFRYVSKVAANVEWMHTVATLCGYSPRKPKVDDVSGCSYLDVIYKPEGCSLKSARSSLVKHSGNVYCCTVSTGMLLTRQEGWVSVSGNCDGHSISFHDSDPNLDSAGSELEKAKVMLEQWHTAFPNMLICNSNHGSLIYRRAKAHGLPVQYIKKYRDVLFPEHGAPGWSWRDGWKINTPLGLVLFKHQASGDVVADAAHEGCNVAVGHEHGQFKIGYAASSTRLYWGMVAGCGIDRNSLAFAYGKHTKNKPMLGCAVIMNGEPVLVPMVMDETGRWVGAKHE